jgi:hypothetical protein
MNADRATPASGQPASALQPRHAPDRRLPVSSPSVQEPTGHAFISYVREDSDCVDELQRTLEAAGVPVWRDTADLWPGQDWREMIRRAITDNALVFIACFSRQSVARKKSYQNEEFVLAVDQLRQRQPDTPWLIPVRFDDCEVPDRDLGGGRRLSSIQRADLFGDRYVEQMTRLVVFVQRLLEQHLPTRTRPHSQDTGVNKASPAAESPGRPGRHMLTERQQRILRFIEAYWATNSHAPNEREIAEGVGLKSGSSAHYHLRILKDSGYLSYTEGTPRSVRLLRFIRPR